MSSDPQAAIREARKACHCLYIAVAEDVADHVKARVEALIALLERETWQPIETAPKDELLILWLDNGSRTHGWFNGEEWVIGDEGHIPKSRVIMWHRWPQPPTGDAP